MPITQKEYSDAQVEAKPSLLTPPNHPTYVKRSPRRRAIPLEQQVAQERPVGRTIHTADGTIRERPRQGKRDRFFLDEETRKDLGVRDDEQLALIRDEERYSAAEGSARGEVWLMEVRQRLKDLGIPGTPRRIIKKDGVATSGQDVDYVAYPKALFEYDERQRQIQADLQYKGCVMDPYGNYTQDDLEIKSKPTRDQIEAMSMANHVSGLIGPTAGRNPEEVYRERGVKRVLEERDFYRDGMFGSTVKSQKEWENFVADLNSQPDFTRALPAQRDFEAQVEQAGRSANARSFGVGNTGLGPSLREKIGKSHVAKAG